MHNDDFDVTKGCEIIVSISRYKNDLKLNSIEHNPYILKSSNTILKLYAGKGVGVVTKDGLNAPKNYAAINSVPLSNLEKLFNNFCINSKELNIYCTISVTNGEQIAKETANSKVGVIGGISILGTTGWVKPISATAYLASITQEINFIKTNNISPVVFTIGNNSFKYAKENYKEQQIIEIGNFVYDALDLCNKLSLYNIVLICGIGKMTKISQGFKNTHNRFGSIDFEKLKNEIKKDLNYDIDLNSTKTVKGVSLQLEKENLDLKFYEAIEYDALKQIKSWFLNIDIDFILS